MPALERGLLILECLAKSRHGLSLSQLTRKLRLPKSTSHALLLTFERSGYLTKEESTGRYRLGSRLYALANTALTGISLRDQAAPFLQKLAQDTGVTVHLAILEQGEAVLIDKVEPPGALRLATWIGKRMGLHCTSLGKALIAHLPDAEVEDLVRKQGLLRHNENTIASLRKLRQSCEEVRRLGYAIDDEEEEIGIRCLGAPVLSGPRDVVAAISISGSTAQMECIPALASSVKATALAISRHLGFEEQEQRDEAVAPTRVSI